MFEVFPKGSNGAFEKAPGENFPDLAGNIPAKKIQRAALRLAIGVNTTRESGRAKKEPTPMKALALFFIKQGLEKNAN